jgi:hypothetical protein
MLFWGLAVDHSFVFVLFMPLRGQGNVVTQPAMGALLRPAFVYQPTSQPPCLPIPNHPMPMPMPMLAMQASSPVMSYMLAAVSRGAKAVPCGAHLAMTALDKTAVYTCR